MVTLTFCIFFGKVVGCLWFAISYRLNDMARTKCAFLMWFVPLKTFFGYGLGREMVEESGEVSDWCRM